MTSHVRPAVPDALAFLELLAEQAPPPAFHELLDRARSAQAGPEEIEHLERARDLALHVQGLFQRWQQREAGLAALVETSRDLTLPYDLDTLLRLINRRARLLLNVDMSYISFPREDSSDSYVHSADGQTTALTEGMRVPGEFGLTADAIHETAPFWSPNYLADQRIRHSPEIDAVVRQEGLQAILVVPMRHGDRSLGVLYTASRTMRHFTPDEVALMRSLADLAAVAIERSRQLRRVEAEITELEAEGGRVRARLAEARHLDESHTRMTALVLGGGDLQALVELAGSMLSGPAAAHGPDGATLAASGEPAAPARDPLLRASLDAHAGGRPVQLPDGAWVAPLAAGQEDLGSLVARPGAPLEGHGERLLTHAARTAALLLLMRRSTTVAENQVRDAFFEDLLTASPEQVDAVRERARRLAVDLDQPHVLVMARPEGGSQGQALVWASSYADRKGGLKHMRDGVITLLLPGHDPAAAARGVSDSLGPLLDHPVTVTAAGPARGADRIRPTLEEARRCLEAVTALGCSGTTACAGELGFLGLLLSDVHDVGTFVEQTIGPVVDYDTKRLTQLARTLETYFAAGSSPTYAAESLHVHPNTVSRRLERITELLGPDWQKPQRALEIQLALRLHRTRRALTGPRGGQAGAP